MNFGYTPGSFPFLILFGFGAIFVVALLFQLLRLILRIAGVRNDSHIFGLYVGMLALLFLGVSVSLDSYGKRVSARIISKRETVTVTARGGWRHNFTLGFQFAAQGIALPPLTKSESALLDAFLKDRGQQFTTLSPSEAVFDRVNEGDPFDLRVLRVGGLSLVRDADQNTFTMLPWRWILPGLLLLGGLFFAWKRFGAWLVLLALSLFLTVPLLQAWRDQRAADDHYGKSEEATAAVRAVHRVTQWDFRGTNHSSRSAFDQFDLKQPYDVIELDYTPKGARGLVLAVDAIDVSADAPASFEKGANVRILYDVANPRDARVEGRARTWHLRDMLGVYQDSALVLGLILLAFAVLGWLSVRARRVRQRLQQAVATAAQAKQDNQTIRRSDNQPPTT